MRRNGIGIWRHIGAFQQDRPDIRVPFHQGVRGLQQIPLGGLDIKAFLVTHNDPGEFSTKLIRPDHRCIQGHIGGGEMIRS